MPPQQAGSPAPPQPAMSCLPALAPHTGTTRLQPCPARGAPAAPGPPRRSPVPPQSGAAAKGPVRRGCCCGASTAPAPGPAVRGPGRARDPGRDRARPRGSRVSPATGLAPGAAPRPLPPGSGLSSPHLPRAGFGGARVRAGGGGGSSWPHFLPALLRTHPAAGSWSWEEARLLPPAPAAAAAGSAGAAGISYLGARARGGRWEGGRHRPSPLRAGERGARPHHGQGPGAAGSRSHGERGSGGETPVWEERRDLGQWIRSYSLIQLAEVGA